jgi:hypothetical protein
MPWALNRKVALSDGHWLVANSLISRLSLTLFASQFLRTRVVTSVGRVSISCGERDHSRNAFWNVDLACVLVLWRGVG